MTNVSVLIGTQMHCLIYWAELWEKSLWLQHVDLFHDAGVRVELSKKGNRSHPTRMVSPCLVYVFSPKHVCWWYYLYFSCGYAGWPTFPQLARWFSVKPKCYVPTSVLWSSVGLRRSTVKTLSEKRRPQIICYTDLEDVFKLQVLSDQQPETQNM